MGVFAAVLVLHGIFIRLVGNQGWDDGAITVAFARTFATSGTIALTPSSPVVEGFSSPLWFLLMSGSGAVIGDRFDALIMTSQVLAALVAALGATLLFGLLRRHMTTLPAAVLAVGLFALGPAINETANGMEMVALSAVALGLATALEREASNWTVAALAVIGPLLRIESVAYLLCGAAALWLCSRWRRKALCLAGGVIAVVVITTAVRMTVFGELVPNTLLAKQSAPYAPADLAERITSTKVVVKELFYTVVPAALLVVGAVLSTRREALKAAGAVRGALSRDPVVVFAVGYIAAVVLVNLALGSNYGYFGRMEQSALPLAVLATARLFPVRWLSSPFHLVATAIALLMFGLYGTHIYGLAGVTASVESVPVISESYRQSGLAMERLRAALATRQLTVLIPDVGGSSLCCPQLRVLDLGLLANPELARTGYDALPDYLALRQPDLIEAHERWATASRIYSIPLFREQYAPIVVDNMWFYLRRPLLTSLNNRCRFSTTALSNAARYRGVPSDELFVATLSNGPICILK